MLRMAKKWGKKGIVLECRESLVGFYKGFGFEERETMVQSDAVIGPHTATVMFKALSPSPVEPSLRDYYAYLYEDQGVLVPPANLQLLLSECRAGLQHVQRLKQ
eukprot:gene35781-3805_t